MQHGCEICGKTLHSPPTKVEIDGAVMLACPSCAKLGRPIGGPLVRKAQGSFQFTMQRSVEPDFELDPDYHVKIRQTRETMGISQEDLGRLINEKPSVISLLETRKLRPDAILTRKLMHHLKVNLLVAVTELEK
ncbi:MAG: helix-turn-helix domain-containing protein [Thaumarchaeota archaeon]|nr:helix-turn-helix domain-containing protein [Nitrososphaerota archaeon]